MDASTDDFIENLEANEDDGECNTEEEEISKAAAVELLEPSVLAGYFQRLGLLYGILKMNSR